jgi:hypothetical protein
LKFNNFSIIFSANSWFKKYGLVAIVIHSARFHISSNLFFSKFITSKSNLSLLIQSKQKSKSISKIKFWFLFIFRFFNAVVERIWVWLEIIQLSIEGGIKFHTLHFSFQNMKTFSSSLPSQFNSKKSSFFRQSECWSICISFALSIFFFYIILYRKVIEWLWLSNIKIGGVFVFSINRKFFKPW